MSGVLEWKINVPNGTLKVLEPERGLTVRMWHKFRNLIIRLLTKIWKFLVASWNIGVAEPKKFTHCIKVGLALSVVSLFYYMRPLYESVGGNAMWAIMTVVVVFEYTVGATLCKSINRGMATILAGSLGVGIHWIASRCGQEYEPMVLGASVFLFASAATFSRFIPFVKARFDYGAMIFILTFSLVSVSGYRVDKLIMMAHQRVTTIAIGTSLCILISMLFCPVWAGDQLHHQVISNLEKLAISLEGYVAEYFSSEETTNVTEQECGKRLQGYKCVLNSKAAEEALVNFARWEPAHGQFHFRYPWQEYLKIGASARTCAYCIDSISSCIDSDLQAPEFLKSHVKEKCMRLSISSSGVLKELAAAIRTSRRTSSIGNSVDMMNLAVQELHSVLKSLPVDILLKLPNSIEENGEKIEKKSKASILDVLPFSTLVTLLIETAARIEEIVLAVDKLASVAEYNTEEEKKSKQTSAETVTNCKDQEAMKTLERV